MNDIKLIKRRYMTQSFLLLTALTLIGVLVMKIGKVDHMVTPVSYTHLDVYKRQMLSWCWLSLLASTIMSY